MNRKRAADDCTHSRTRAQVEYGASSSLVEIPPDLRHEPWLEKCRITVRCRRCGALVARHEQWIISARDGYKMLRQYYPSPWRHLAIAGMVLGAIVAAISAIKFI